MEPPRVIEEHEKHFTQNELDLILGDCFAAEANRKGRLERYWVPMIAAYSGARLNEICQLDESGISHYTGEGKVGDMTFTKGNKAIRNHVENGKELLLFESVKKGTPLQFIGHFKYLGHHNETRPDQNREWRKAIIFELTFSNSPHQSIDDQSTRDISPIIKSKK